MEPPDADRRPLRSPGSDLSRPRAESVARPARSFRSAPVAGASRGDRSWPGTTVPSRAVLRTVVRAFPPAPLRDGARIRLSLQPAHLGELVIEVSAGRSGVRARIRTETDAARDLILAHLDDLRRDLEKRGVRISRFDVDLAGRIRREQDARTGPPGPRSHRRQVLDLDA